MKVPESWLREWVQTDLGTKQISEQLTLAGLEVDEVLKPDLTLDGVIVASVRSVAKHPSSEPSQQPSEQPTEQPTGRPSEAPTEEPSEQPTLQPTGQPSEEPTEEPSLNPTERGLAIRISL